MPLLLYPRAAAAQFKSLTRITVKPLVETLPCLGGVTVSLMEVRACERLMHAWCMVHLLWLASS